jgi:hypothetical protein
MIDEIARDIHCHQVGLHVIEDPQAVVGSIHIIQPIAGTLYLAYAEAPATLLPGIIVKTMGTIGDLVLFSMLSEDSMEPVPDIMFVAPGKDFYPNLKLALF